MSTTKNDDGGPAFPIPYGQIMSIEGMGMSLRDWFAGQATEEDIDAHQEYVKDIGGMVPKYTREQAKYRYADAMIAARKGAQ